MSFIICALIVLTKRWHSDLTNDKSEGVQRFHSIATPRVGGVAVYLAVLGGWLQSSGELSKILSGILVAAIPAFGFGLLEDLTKHVSVKSRLFATMFSGLIACLLSGYSLTRLDIIGIDQILKFGPISILFTAFAVGGVANAINIIDGFNGLSSSTSFIIFIGLALIANASGDLSLAMVNLLFAASVLGFFVLNWPMGKIFLGDGGAYFIGFAIAWSSVLLSERHSHVTAFVALMVCIHPITEVVFSIYRRRLRKLNPGDPDRLHFHSLVHTRYVRRWFSFFSNTAQNSITGLLVGLMTALPVILAQYMFSSIKLSIITAIALALSYLVIYRKMVRFRWLV